MAYYLIPSRFCFSQLRQLFNRSTWNKKNAINIIFGMIHELKVLPQYFRAVLEKRKTFEVRRNDRPFAVGDGICLREFDPLSEHEYTGRVWYGNITYILNDPLYCKKGFAIMGIEEDGTAF